MMILFSKVIYNAAIKATSYYLEFLKSGEQNLFDNSLSILKTCIELSEDLNYIDYWWWLYCLSFIFEEVYHENSFWKHLKSFNNRGVTSSYLKGILIRRHLKLSYGLLKLNQFLLLMMMIEEVFV